MFYGVICLIMALTGSFIWLAIMSTLVRLVTYMVCIAALPRLARNTEAHDDVFNIPGGMLVPGFAMVLCLWLISQASVGAWLTMGGFFILGSGLYFWTKRE